MLFYFKEFTIVSQFDQDTCAFNIDVITCGSDSGAQM